MFTPEQLRLQQIFDTTRLAQKTRDNIVDDRISEKWRDFIQQRDMLFIASCNAQGQPACSYKGGDRGFVQVLDDHTLEFPLYDGNGLFISAGNVQASAQIELLFIDFENPQRLRVGGSARIRVPQPADEERYPEALLFVTVTVSHVYVNCKRYVHRYTLAQASPYVPQAGRPTPFAEWKMLPYIHAVLPASDLERLRIKKERHESLPAACGQPEKNPLENKGETR